MRYFAAILRILIRKWAVLVNEWRFGSVLKVPYTVFLMLVGIAIAAIGIAVPEVLRWMVYWCFITVTFLHLQNWF